MPIVFTAAAEAAPGAGAPASGFFPHPAVIATAASPAHIALDFILRLFPLRGVAPARHPACPNRTAKSTPWRLRPRNLASGDAKMSGPGGPRPPGTSHATTPLSTLSE
jgi:hypothetical protein